MSISYLNHPGWISACGRALEQYNDSSLVEASCHWPTQTIPTQVIEVASSATKGISQKALDVLKSVPIQEIVETGKSWLNFGSQHFDPAVIVVVGLGVLMVTLVSKIFEVNEVVHSMGTQYREDLFTFQHESGLREHNLRAPMGKQYINTQHREALKSEVENLQLRVKNLERVGPSGVQGKHIGKLSKDMMGLAHRQEQLERYVDSGLREMGCNRSILSVADAMLSSIPE